MLIDSPLRRAADSRGSKAALRSSDSQLTYQELAQRVATACVSMRAQGIEKGARVAIIADNSIEQIVTLLALWHLGAVAMPLNLRLTESDWQRQIKQAQVEMVLTGFDDEILSGFNQIKLLQLDSVPRNHRDGAPRPLPTQLDVDQPAAIIFTSGSSGHTKGAILTIGNLYYNALGANQNLPLVPDDCWLLNLPLSHVSGLGVLWRCLLAGASIHLRSQFDDAETSSLILTGAVSHLSLVPTMLQRLLRAQGNLLFPASLKAVLIGGAPLPDSVRESCIQRHVPIICSYGLTEAASQVTATPLNTTTAAIRTSGKALPYREIQIRNDGNAVVPAGEIGAIWIRGEVLFRGYLDADQNKFDSARWFDTGDLGSLSADGYLTVVGRKDQMFISGGENIYPQEIEQVAYSFPSIARCACVPQPDVEWGERPILFIESDPGSIVDTIGLSQLLHERLARFKAPKKIVVLKLLPTVALGKIDYAKLREMAKSMKENDAD